ncbi:MAG: GIY-YIG nuclease family protein [Oscillospiraceae bacterium]|nr:GIY-YIG nuclease family protein [Oscillospiraceae bacterium]
MDLTWLSQLLQQHIYIVAGALVLLMLLFVLIRNRRKITNSRLRRKIRSGKFIHYTEFEENWITEDSEGNQTGYKYNDFSGCYVIMIFEKKVHFNRFKNYDNIYIGQSVNVCQRVHNHFSGKGKGDVYADIKYGMEAYVRIIPCKVKKLNDMEKKLIEAFNATESYNKTKGGAKLTKK